jgi:hypothetical protein
MAKSIEKDIAQIKEEGKLMDKVIEGLAARAHPGVSIGYPEGATKEKIEELKEKGWKNGIPSFNQFLKDLRERGEAAKRSTEVYKEKLKNIKAAIAYKIPDGISEEIEKQVRRHTSVLKNSLNDEFYFKGYDQDTALREDAEKALSALSAKLNKIIKKEEGTGEGTDTGSTPPSEEDAQVKKFKEWANKNLKGNIAKAKEAIKEFLKKDSVTKKETKELVTRTDNQIKALNKKLLTDYGEKKYRDTPEFKALEDARKYLVENAQDAIWNHYLESTEIQTFGKHKVTFVPKGDERLKLKDGKGYALALTNSEGIFVQKEITAKDVLDYISHGDKNSYGADQKAVVTARMLEKHGVNLPDIIGKMNDATAKRFIIYHEIDHVEAGDLHSGNYKSRPDQTIAESYRLGNKDNPYLADSAIQIEARANMNALKKLNLWNPKTEKRSQETQEQLEKKYPGLLPWETVEEYKKRTNQQPPDSTPKGEPEYKVPFFNNASEYGDWVNKTFLPKQLTKTVEDVDNLIARDNFTKKEADTVTKKLNETAAFANAVLEAYVHLPGLGDSEEAAFLNRIYGQLKVYQENLKNRIEEVLGEDTGSPPPPTKFSKEEIAAGEHDINVATSTLDAIDAALSDLKGC